MMIKTESFRLAARQVEQWLQSSTCDALTEFEWTATSLLNGRFVLGWQFPIQIADRSWRLGVLLPAGFPAARPRIALLEPDHSFLWPKIERAWPHVEDDGLLCLPAREQYASQPIEAVHAALNDAFELIASNAAAIDTAEFQREFPSYWNRTTAGLAIWSLLSIRPASRRIAARVGKRRVLVADTEEQIVRWCRNRGIEANDIVAGLFLWLKEPPTPLQYPKTFPELKRWLDGASDDNGKFFNSFPFRGPATPIVFAADAGRTGAGLGGVLVYTPREASVNGFRPGHAPEKFVRRARLRKATVSLRKADRFDAGWINGRGHDEHQPKLYQSAIVVLGCGSLGSHISARLAQAGVGTIRLVDSELLESANVGRHVLGIRRIGQHKATALAQELRNRFPHLQSVEGHEARWGDIDSFLIESIKSSDLIISAIGDWGEESSLNEWHHAEQDAPPVIFAWLEEHAAAGHGLLVADNTSCLRCLLNDDGSTRIRDTDWESGTVLITEPACGADFQPYGPIDLAYTEAAVAELALDMLVGRVTQNCLATYCTSTERLLALGGKWSPYHLANRPRDFDGALVTRRSAPTDPNCPICGKS